MRLYSIVSLLILGFLSSPLHANSRLAFWDEQRKGANGGGEDADAAYFEAAAAAGIDYIRLSPTNMKSDSRDFLMGDADKFFGIPESDLAKLVTALDHADDAGVKIVLTTFTLPGRRWRQHNEMEFDFRLWNDHAFQDQVIAFWQELAFELKDHPAVVGYNIVNEPHPEREAGFQAGQTEGFDEWLAENEGGIADLNRFYVMMVNTVRSVDSNTPIFLDSRFHASPAGFPTLKPIDDDAVFYSFHCYEPWNYTTFRVNKERFAYPDRMPTGNGDETEAWTRADLAPRFAPMIEWTKTHGVPVNRIHLAEIGCDRKVEGAQQYLTDLISIANEQGWHWAFYSYRSSGWDGMNYELGPKKLNWKQWQAIEKGTQGYNDFILEGENPLWEVIAREMKD